MTVARPIALAGGVPLILSRVEGTLDDVLDVLDAVVIAGGRDIEPHRYGQEPHELLGNPDPHRDEFELELVRRTVERGLPLLARGADVNLQTVHGNAAVVFADFDADGFAPVQDGSVALGPNPHERSEDDLSQVGAKHTHTFDNVELQRGNMALVISLP